ncbi:hypothetical protein IJI17_01260 [Candidatus Saccharibacteria bacterium]|nr:hypothetical protein [Candidatus Saccharibacteria bacterium]
MVKAFRPRGFTVIEVSLFLALSGLLMVGLIVGTNASISRQRYNDSVNNFAEYLRTAYNDVANISNDNNYGGENGAGRSSYAIYGKLLTFGETGTSYSEVLAYDVVGYAVNSANVTDSDTLAVLNKVQANIVYNASAPPSSEYHFYRQIKYTAPWSASFEQPDGHRFRGMILIVRSPVSGIIQTYHHVDNYVLDIQSTFDPDSNNTFNNFKNLLAENKFVRGSIDICIDSEDNSNKRRRDVRIDKFAVNSSGVALIALDSEDNTCGDGFASDPPIADD